MTSREGRRDRGRPPAPDLGSTFARDLYGLSREASVVGTNVRQVFTPHQPIREIDLLAGRQAEVQKLIETLNTPGQHVLLYGERGVGKSSLANIVSQVLVSATTRSISHFIKRCDQSDTFESMLDGPLQAVGVNTLRAESTQSVSATVKGEVKLFDIGGGRERQHENTATYRTRPLTPSVAAQHLQNLDGFIVIDELDALPAERDRKQLAELIKQLSDSGSPFKIMLIGIADTGAELTEAHPSVQRCLREAKLSRMTDEELRAIVSRGAARLRISFDPRVIDSIVQASAGYPHFTHLLALKCAEQAIADSRSFVAPPHLPDAMAAAVEDAEGTLKRQYENSVRSSSASYSIVIVAAASIDSEEFSTAQVRAAVDQQHLGAVTNRSLGARMRRLVSTDGSTILRRAGRGIYRFEDPRMRSYVRIVNQII